MASLIEFSILLILGVIIDLHALVSLIFHIQLQFILDDPITCILLLD